MLFEKARSIRQLAAPAMVVLAALALPSSSIGQDQADSSAISVDEEFESEMVFLSGEEIVASQRTTDDLFAAGGTVEAKGVSADHLFLTGGDITVSNAEVRDLIAAGGEVRLNAANVADDLIAAGGEVIAGEGFEIGGTAIVTGGTVRFNAPVGQDLRIGANEIFVDSTVAGTSRLSGSKIVIGPNARLQGDLLYRGDDLTIDPSAVIEGDRTELPAWESYNPEEAGAGLGSFFVYFSLSILISYFVIVSLLVLVLPSLMQRTSDMLHATPLRALGIGVLYAFVVPVMGILLVWTVLGIPLAIFLFLASLALTPLAVAVTAYFVGMLGRRVVSKRSDAPRNTAERFIWPLAGVAILFALSLIPLLGLLVMLFSMLFGLGALLRQATGALTALPSASVDAPRPATA
ncbi:bactofilin family protein [Altererythrobacter lutimaris]|uniref:DUF8173 domain-containing protein n=1 Tax=Altererythrobacter lutimaris TaxID=2743979 RepID=A0A850HCS0_9SPHN|nr:hypothetical protein [Altererythrobacter lutimaris]NVE96023.1 hypothetical protein [Altererythrobacter lutimaris]